MSLIVGLIGGIGSGKTTVAGFFRDCGAKILDADKIGHCALKLPKVKRAIVKIWGDEVLNKNGNINRCALAKRVFQSEKDIKKLNAILHPIIAEKIDTITKKRTNYKKMIVIDAPLLIESGFSKKCDRLIFVHAPLNLRRKRTSLSKRWDKNEIVKRERFQLPLNKKRRVADFIIDNSKDKKYTFASVKHVVRSLRQ